MKEFRKFNYIRNDSFTENRNLFLIMKKTLQLFLFITLSAITANAQRSGDFEMGFHGGLNLANVTTSDGQSNAKPRISFNIAATGEYLLI